MAFSENRLILIALAAGLGIFAVLFAAGFPLTDGVFVYPLDDTYIHLSMAEQIAKGSYGINLGEYASADSSILYPVLLTPFSGTDFHQYMPLVLNVFALGFALVLLTKILVASGLTALPNQKLFIIFVIVLAPIALNFQGISLLGMEHMLHVDTVLMALLGVLRWRKTGKLNWLLVAAVLLGPLLRYEGMGLSLLIVLALFIWGHKIAAIVLAAGVVAPVVGVGFWLESHGLSFLPNSVMAKASFAGEGESVILKLLANNFGPFGSPLYTTLFYIAGISVLLFAVLPGLKLDHRFKVLALITSGMVLGHAALGKFGWANRYEIYALTFLSLAVVVMLTPLIARAGQRGVLAKAGVLAVLALGVSHYVGFTIVWAINGPGNIYNQQWQMSELVERYEGDAVLANDIGLVSFQSDTKIVDIFGLASVVALEARRTRAPRGWLNQMAIDEDAGMAMMYDDWFKRNLSPGWVPVAY